MLERSFGARLRRTLEFRLPGACVTRVYVVGIRIASFKHLARIGQKMATPGMSYLDTIKTQIGQDRFERLEKEAEKELSLALNMPLKNQYGDKQYYRKRVLIGELFDDCQFFDEKGLGILPIDLVDAMFRGKLLFASHDEKSTIANCRICSCASNRFVYGCFVFAPERFCLVRLPC